MGNANLSDGNWSAILAFLKMQSGIYIKLIEQLKTVTPVVPPKSNRKESREYDWHIYKERSLTECFIG